MMLTFLNCSALPPGGVQVANKFTLPDKYLMPAGCLLIALALLASALLSPRYQITQTVGSTFVRLDVRTGEMRAFVIGGSTPPSARYEIHEIAETR